MIQENQPSLEKNLDLEPEKKGQDSEKYGEDQQSPEAVPEAAPEVESKKKSEEIIQPEQEQQPQDQLQNQDEVQEKEPVDEQPAKKEETQRLLAQSKPNQNLKYWDYNDHNEVYLIKPESLKKSYDNIVKKLQKERVKFIKKNTTQEEEQALLPLEQQLQVEKDSKELRDGFSLVKDIFSKKYKTRQLLFNKQSSLKRRVESIQEEIRQEQIRNLKDTDLAQMHTYERQKVMQINQKDSNNSNYLHKK